MIEENKLIESITIWRNEIPLGDEPPIENFVIVDTLDEVLSIIDEQPKVGEWISVAERLPDVDEYILVSFANFSVPMIGRYTVDDTDSGTFRVGDEDDSFVQHDLYVNAWMPLPEPYEEESNE